MTAFPLVELNPYVTLVLNVALWASAQVLSGYIAHRQPLARLQRDGWVLRLRGFEDDGRWYERTLRIGRWKDRMPEAGAFFAGGMTKRTLPPRSDGGIERFAAETRRAERAHWGSFLCLPFCVIWNGLPGIVVMVAYGLIVNLPLITIQRYNRGRAERILRRRARRSVAPTS